MSEQLTLAEWVSRETEQRGWSLREVARRSITPKRPQGYTVTTVAEIAKGKRTSIDYDVAFGLANAFGVTRDEVLGCGSGGKLMTISQAAIHLHCSPRKIHRLIDKRQLPALRMGNGYYINVADLNRWLRTPRQAANRPNLSVILR